MAYGGGNAQLDREYATALKSAKALFPRLLLQKIVQAKFHFGDCAENRQEALNSKPSDIAMLTAYLLYSLVGQHQQAIALYAHKNLPPIPKDIYRRGIYTGVEYEVQAGCRPRSPHHLGLHSSDPS